MPADPSTLPPPGTAVRAPGWDDLDAVTALHQAASRARTGAIRLRREDLRLRWLGMETLTDALLVEDALDGRLLAYAAFEADHDPVDDVLDLHVDAVVHPEETGRGLAGFLLDRAIARARAEAVRAGHRQATLTTALADGDDPARAFHAAKGFQPVRHLLELHLDLFAPPPAPTWPAGFRARRWREGDDEVAWRTHQAAFADVPTHLPLSLEEFRTDRLRPAAGFDPDLTWLATTDDGREVGLLLGRAGTPVAPEDGWVRDLGVLPDLRRHGIGMSLLREAFAAFRTHGLSGVGLDVDDVTLDGAVALYRRAGMRIVRRTDVLARPVHVDVDDDDHAGDAAPPAVSR
ncbi:MAG: GNAT family N-acetyltransferase [Nitriliruptoraceae bacterium]|nr:GNAT family N-acetyltransferase [Nitriliruptoraceae bacterium]